MKSILIITAVTLLATFTNYASEKARDPRLELKEKETPPTCVQLGKSCMVCSDEKKRKVASDKVSLTLSDYECAKGTKVAQEKMPTLPAILVKMSKCEVLSDFCAVCEDGSFISTKSGNKLVSDLYECATSPRTKWE